MSGFDLIAILLVVAGYVYTIWVVVVYIGSRRLGRIENHLGRIEAQLAEQSRQLDAHRITHHPAAEYVEQEQS